ncbi:MAG TPA: phage portal protein [Solirubrobacteraceae bacterium]|nr:phage portal protein [Solirubrobacteraceae bacterium]
MSPLASLKLPAVLACVRLLAESVSTLPLGVFQGTGPARTPVEGGLTQLLERPSPGTTLPNLLGMTVAHMALSGNCFWGKLRNGEGQIEQLAAIPPDRVAVEVVGGEPFYTLHLDTGSSVHGTFDILHMRMPLSLDGVLGVSPVFHARETLGLAAVVEQTASSLFSNSAVPRGVLAVATPGADSDDLMENLSAGFSARHGGPQNAGRVAVIDATAVTYSAVSLSPADAELLATLRLSDTAIARIFRVPPHLIAAESGNSMTYSNTEQEGLDFLRYSLAPYLTAIEAAVSTDPDLCLPDESVEFDRSRFEQAGALERAQANALALGRWKTADEIRADEGRPPLAAPLPVIPAALPNGDTQHALA